MLNWLHSFLTWAKKKIRMDQLQVMFTQRLILFLFRFILLLGVNPTYLIRALQDFHQPLLSYFILYMFPFPSYLATKCFLYWMITFLRLFQGVSAHENLPVSYFWHCHLQKPPQCIPFLDSFSNYKTESKYLQVSHNKRSPPWATVVTVCKQL